MNIYISGSMAYDRIMDFPGYFKDYILPDKIHMLNVCFNVNGLQEKFGGTAGNIAYSLSLLEEKATIIAAIGKDYASYFKWLGDNNIPTEGIEIIQDEFTAGAYITTDRSDNQITGFNPGAMKHPTSYRIDKASGNSIMLIAPGNLNDMTGYAASCGKLGIPYICDPGQSLTLWNRDLMKEWISGSMILITNDYELEVIMDMTGLDKNEILDLTGIIITTHGERGSLISTRKKDIQIPSVKARAVIDPTGAGDAYRAGLLKGISMGRDIETSAKMGAVAASYAVEKYGTQEHRYSFREFSERYSANFGHM